MQRNRPKGAAKSRRLLYIKTPHEENKKMETGRQERAILIVLQKTEGEWSRRGMQQRKGLECSTRNENQLRGNNDVHHKRPPVYLNAAAL
jgi:hypothetical protein